MTERTIGIDDIWDDECLYPYPPRAVICRCVTRVAPLADALAGVCPLHNLGTNKWNSEDIARTHFPKVEKAAFR